MNKNIIFGVVGIAIFTSIIFNRDKEQLKTWKIYIIKKVLSENAIYKLKKYRSSIYFCFICIWKKTYF